MIGQTITHYRILEKLGEGGMGVVYKAHDTTLERDVALKFLPSHVSITAEAKSRFLQEAKAAAALNHAHICTVHGVEADGEQMFIVMEFVEGGTLRNAIPYPSVDDAVLAAIQIGEALEEAHAKGIVHRDIKADNIMLTSRGQAKVMDFGLAKLKGSLKLTRTSSTAGTLGYMAPEQIQGSDVDHRSDIFSFGVLLFEMLTGKLPFRGEHEAAMMYSILNEDPDPIGRYLPQASPELVHILNRALEKNPLERYQHVSDMVIDLRRLRKDTSKISRKTVPVMPAAGQPASPDSRRSADTPAQEPAPAGESRKSTTVTFTIPGLAGRKKTLLLLPAALVAAALAGYFLLSGSSEDASGERVPVAVADFINQTKEEELDGLSGMLITSLEQSRRLSVLTRSRMFDILRAMGKGDVDRIDESLGRAVSRQANVKALVIASLSRFDDLYIIDMKVLDPEKNEYILTLKEQAKGRAEIPGSIDKLSEQIRLGLKERRAEVEKNSQDVAVMTTPNLEAYQAYFRGEELVNRLEFPKAADEFRKAVAIDSGFAIAYYRLAYSLSWTGSPGAREAIEKAMRYVDRVPEKEKYLIRAEAAVTRQDPLAAVALYRQLLDVYPEDKEANYLYGDYCFHFLDYENAERALTRVLAMDQKHERAYQHLCWTLLRHKGTGDLRGVARAYVTNAPGPTAYSMLAESYAVRGEFDSALQICATGLERFPEDPWLRVQRGNIFLTTFSFSAAETEYSLLTGKEESYEQQTNGHLGLQVVAIAGGRYRSAMRSVETLIDLARAKKDTAGMAFWSMEKARMHVLFFRDAEAGKAAGAGAREFEGDATEPYFYAAFAYFLRSGEYQRAREIATRRLAITGPELPHMADATEAFSSGNYGSAVEHLRKIRVVDPRVQYMLAQCYEALDQPRTTITVLEELRRNYSTHEFGSYREYAEFAVRSYYLTGKAYEKLNDRRNARQSYERFLELWKQADADIPEVLDAKKRLGALS